MPRVLRNESSSFHPRSFPLLFLSSFPLPFRLLKRIQFRKKAARTNSASTGMVKLRNFSSRSDVSNHSGERRAAFTRILFCCLDTYISRLIARARAKKGKITATNKFRPHSESWTPLNIFSSADIKIMIVLSSNFHLIIMKLTSKIKEFYHIICYLLSKN